MATTPEDITDTQAALARAIEARAQQAYDDLMRLINEGVDPRKAIRQVQQQFTGDYVGALSEAFSMVLQREITPAHVLALPVGEVVLSKRLHAINAEIQTTVSILIREHAQGLQDARRLALRLYDGYDPGDGIKRPLEGVARADLPRALRELTREPRTRESLTRVMAMGQEQAARLKSETLKAAYGEMVDAWVKGEGQKALEKRLWVAQREKNRYNANRIAQTELARAHQAKVGEEFMADSTIEVVQVRMNPRHPLPDICDLHATADLHGLGPGCYPKGRAPVPPFHPFCWCKLSSRPDKALADATARRQSVQDYLGALPPAEAARIMGSKERLAAVMRGASVDDVVNAGKDPMYRLKRLGEVLGRDRIQY